MRRLKVHGIAMRRFLSALVAGVLLAAVAGSAVASPPVPLLRKVSHADNSVYLLGSFHLLKPGDYPLSGDVDAAFADAQSLLFEIPPDEMASPTLALRMQQSGLRTDGTRLDADLSGPVRAKLADWLDANAGRLQRTGVTPASIQMLKPWLAALMISLVEMDKAGLDPALGLDAHLAAQAKADGKPTGGLETGTQQIAFLDSMDRSEQIQFLAEALDESANGNDELERLHAAWRRGDVATLWNGMAEQMKHDYPGLFRHIDVERNDAWVPKIRQRLQAPGHDNTLVVVGALHLLGREGVVEQLRAKGYRVERICSACAGGGR
jgi:uncharacterized protein YbaP (TraB family)